MEAMRRRALIRSLRFVQTIAKCGDVWPEGERKLSIARGQFQTYKDAPDESPISRQDRK
jgi:hypothetical protein